MSYRSISRSDYRLLKENLKRILKASIENKSDCTESISLVLMDALFFDEHIAQYTSSFKEKNEFRCGDCGKAFEVIVENVCRDCGREQGFYDHINNWKGFQRERFIATLYKSLPYEIYLKTDHWQSERRHCLYRFKEKCAVCSSGKDLEVHHRTYDNLGAEESNDIVCLCSKCHGLFHAESSLKRG